MATTRIMPLHTGKGRSVGTAIRDILDYVKNPDKTDQGRLITARGCNVPIADAEFLFSKQQYLARTGRRRGADDVIAYHVRQAFVPGEVTPEEANRIGVEFARRFTKDDHAFIVCTHIDRAHVHNHIIWNSTSLDCTRKFRNFWGSTRAVRRLSDTLCVENGLSIVEDPKPKGQTYDKWLGTQAKPSHRELLRQAIDKAMERVPARRAAPAPAVPKVDLLVDIQAKLRAGKGAGYARWASKFNLKQMAQTLSYLNEHGLMDYKVLSEKTEAATARRSELSEKIKAAEKRMAEIAVLRTHIVNYAKTRDTYTAYRKAGYSAKFRSEHEADILLHQAAKRAFDDLNVKKLPKGKDLQAEYAALLAEKKAAYTELRKARDEARELLTVKANVDRVLQDTRRESAQKKEHEQR